MSTMPALLPAKRPVLGVGITHASFAEQLQCMGDLGRSRASAYVCCVNAHMTVEAQESGFAQVVNGADLATADGMPVVYAMRWLNKVEQERVAGNDLLPALLERAANEGLGVYMYGGSEETQRRIVERAMKEYPAIRFVGQHAPPFAPLEALDLDAEAERIRSSGASFVLVSLGCPKQERFMAAMKGRVPGVMFGLGGAFLLYAGIDRRAPKWMRRFALEWLYRLALEPKRLWRRYLVTNTRFIVLLVRQMLGRSRAVEAAGG